ncbi:unnamed protein product, partial [Closterium sp. NIES-65]
EVRGTMVEAGQKHIAVEKRSSFFLTLSSLSLILSHSHTTHLHLISEVRGTMVEAGQKRIAVEKRSSFFLTLSSLPLILSHSHTTHLHLISEVRGTMVEAGLKRIAVEKRSSFFLTLSSLSLILSHSHTTHLHLISEVRGTMVEAGLKRIAVEKLTREQMDGMSWGELEKRIEGWRRQTRLAVHVVFMAERELCETVLAGLEPHTGKAFADLAGLTLGMLFGFGEAVARSKKSPEKVSVLMDMYETMRDLMPQVEVVFAGSACDAIRGSAQQLLQHLAAAAKEAFNNFELAVESEDSDKVLPDGATHGLTSYVVNYLKYLYDYQATMQELFGRENLFGEATIRIFAALHANLERKSKLYRDPALTQLFLMNNVHYIVHAVRKGELKEVVGKDWIDRQRRIVQQHAAAYQRTSWNKIFGLLTSAGLNADGKEGSVSRSALKERFRVFNATFEELHRSQCMWKIPDPELRSAVQLQIAEVLLPAYRAFVQRYTPVLESGGRFGRSSEAASKYIRFTEEGLDSLLNEFFQGRESRNILLSQPAAR